MISGKRWKASRHMLPCETIRIRQRVVASKLRARGSLTRSYERFSFRCAACFDATTWFDREEKLLYVFFLRNSWQCQSKIVKKSQSVQYAVYLKGWIHREPQTRCSEEFQNPLNPVRLQIPGDHKPVETAADNQKVRPAQVLTHAGIFAGGYYSWLRFLAKSPAVRK
jgi:hypothetical protein